MTADEPYNLSEAEKHLVKCTCAAKAGVIGHAAFCPLGDGTAGEWGFWPKPEPGE
jgi:hypothetical protein